MFFMCIASVFIIGFLLIYRVFFLHEINFSVSFPTLIMLICVAGVLVLLIKGYYGVASNFLIIAINAGCWAILFLSR